MEITIKLDNIWVDEDDTLEANLARHIKEQVYKQIYISIQTLVEKQVTMEVKAQVEKSLFQKIQKIVSEVIATEEVSGEYSGSPKVSIKQWITDQFMKNTGYRSPQEQIKEMAKKLGDEMKSRYDMTFASAIVARMQENNLLKDDVAKTLLTEKPTTNS